MTMGMFCCTKNFSSHSTDSRSRWLVGSSSNKMLGSCSKILPKPMRIFQPPLKEATEKSASCLVKPMASSTLSTFPVCEYASSVLAFSCSPSISSSTACMSSAWSGPVKVANFASESASFCNVSKPSLNTLVSSSRSVRLSTSSSVNSCRSSATRRSTELFTRSPVVCSKSPAKILIMVVFPHPLGPTSPTRSPVFTSQVASDKTSWFLNTTPT
mmetsp:Transcript_41864/g.77507  ORF Transcript_41864/g.77507 Transcript_41864/m.77507 type:complete len:214 (-) Transcript_41864:150-791(-)